MDIYIKNMKMPTAGHILIVLPSGRTLEVSADSTQNIFGEAQAIAVPPHGRLGDLDALIEKCEEMADKEDGNQLGALVLLKWFLEQNVPIVIPAEEGE